MEVTQKEIDRAKATFEATEFEGDLRVGFMRAMNSGRTLLRYIKQLETENKCLYEDMDEYERILGEQDEN